MQYFKYIIDMPLDILDEEHSLWKLKSIAGKAIYKFYYHYAYPLGISTEKPTLVPDYIEDKNGHILPYVKFVGGSLKIAQNALKILNNL